MTRLEALEHLHRTVRAYDEMSVGNVRWADVRAALDALSALPPPTEPGPVGEVVDVALWRDKSGFCVLVEKGSHDDNKGSGRMRRLGVARLPLVVGEAEG